MKRKRKMLKRLKLFWFRRRLRKGVRVLEVLDDWMKDAGYKRHEIRQFWREVNGSEEARKRLFERMKG